MNMQTAQDSYAQAKKRLLLLDYDGTLMELKPTPPEATPSPEVINLLHQLCDDPHNIVAVISGRDYPTLDAWLGQLPIFLIAEHGLFTREPRGSWRHPDHLMTEWKEAIRPYLEKYVATVTGSLIEEKPAALAWHYRSAIHMEQALKADDALYTEMLPIAKAARLQLLRSKCALEIRPEGTDKGKSAARLLQQVKADFILAAGDDVTDEALFKVMPEDALTIKVGTGESAASSRLADPAELRAFLAGLCATISAEEQEEQ